MADGEIAYLVWNDLVGLSRTRGVPAADLPKRRNKGLGWALAGQSLTPFEDIAPNPWGPMSEVRQTPDLDAQMRVVLKPDVPALNMVMCDTLNTDGSPWECCTRSFLKAALDDLEAGTGLSLMIAYENEFLLTGDGIDWAAPFSLDAVRSVAPFADLCVAALLDAGVDLEAFEPEYGVGQYEVSCGPARGVAGADRVIFTREVIREAARQSGLRATFTPKPAPDAVGNGCHLHVSLWDAKGRPAGFDPKGTGELSLVAQHFVAGMQRHLRGLLAFAAPSPVSYLRLGPHHWSCGYDGVGVANREAAIRICPSPEKAKSKRGNAFNIEIRATDATASPYLAIGTLVRAGLEGIREKLPLPTLLESDPADMSAKQRKAAGVKPLPSNLDEALDLFAADKVVQGWFTPVMIEAYTALKRLEAANFTNADTAHMCARYARAY